MLRKKIALAHRLLYGKKLPSMFPPTFSFHETGEKKLTFRSYIGKFGL